MSAMGPPVIMGEYDPEPIDDDEKRQLAAFKKSGGLIKAHSNDVMKDFLKGMARPGKKKRETPQIGSTEQIDDAAILKAKEALEAGRLSEQKDEQHDAKRNDMIR